MEISVILIQKEKRKKGKAQGKAQDSKQKKRKEKGGKKKHLAGFEPPLRRHLSPLRDKIINPATRGLRPRFARNYLPYHTFQNEQTLKSSVNQNHTLGEEQLFTIMLCLFYLFIIIIIIIIIY